MGSADREPSDRRERAWKRLLNSSIETQLQSIKIVNSNVFEDQTIEFGRALALIGAHGSGKSAILHAIQAAFGASESDHVIPPFVRRHIYGPAEHLTGVFDITVTTKNGSIRKVVDIDADPEDLKRFWWPGMKSSSEPRMPEDWWPDYCSFESTFLRFHLLYQDIKKLPQGLDPEVLSHKRVVALNEILGREFDWIKRYTVEVDQDYLAAIYRDRRA